jgi:hypothetical protein
MAEWRIRKADRHWVIERQCGLYSSAVPGHRPWVTAAGRTDFPACAAPRRGPRNSAKSLRGRFWIRLINASPQRSRLVRKLVTDLILSQFLVR